MTNADPMDFFDQGNADAWIQAILRTFSRLGERFYNCTLVVLPKQKIRGFGRFLVPGLWLHSPSEIPL